MKYLILVLFAAVFSLVSCNNSNYSGDELLPGQATVKLDTSSTMGSLPAGYLEKLSLVRIESSSEQGQAIFVLEANNLVSNKGSISKLYVNIWQTPTNEIDSNVRFSTERVASVPGILVASKHPALNGSVRIPFSFSADEAIVINISNTVENDNYQIYNQASTISSLYSEPSLNLRLKPLSHQALSNEKVHWLFVTSQIFSGDLGGLQGADVKCQDLAKSANLTGNFHAFLADSTLVPSDRITVAGPIYNMNHERVANSARDLWSGEIFAALNYSEKGLRITSPIVWTGTSDAGTLSSYTCDDWHEGTSAEGGAFGNAANVDTSLPLSKWQGGETDYCENEKHLYCINQF